ncbi:hypothetical protein NliqN6_2382 [Naganishia liquefaciens]|uniref:Uncharacterized protein n=1 Tax=Naganishia liquefaciens TaxID=104408 RepID=A0A8H3TSS2_9TREE|nr:hypothetical protein NliqN6_2382 [Naganishia liquefaciens]
MPPPPQTMGDGGVWQKVKMGALMGSGVGLTIGFIFGSFSILRGGPGPRGALATLSQYMLSSAATFGFFMSIGSVIRTDSPYALPIGYSPTLIAAATSGPVFSSALTHKFRSAEKVEVEVMPRRAGANRWL